MKSQTGNVETNNNSTYGVSFSIYLSLSCALFTVIHNVWYSIKCLRYDYLDYMVHVFVSDRKKNKEGGKAEKR